MFSSYQKNTCLIHNTEQEENTEKSSAVPSQRRPKVQEGAARGHPQRCRGFHSVSSGKGPTAWSRHLVTGERGWAESAFSFPGVCGLTTEAPSSW